MIDVSASEHASGLISASTDQLSRSFQSAFPITYPVTIPKQCSWEQSLHQSWNAAQLVKCLPLQHDRLEFRHSAWEQVRHNSRCPESQCWKGREVILLLNDWPSLPESAGSTILWALPQWHRKTYIHCHFCPPHTWKHKCTYVCTRTHTYTHTMAEWR